MRTMLVLVFVSLLLAGCQTGRSADQADSIMMQKTVGREQLLQTLDQITPPPMGADIMNQSDEKVIGWIRQVDDWTHRVLSAPVTGGMDRYAMQEMRSRLMQVYTRDMADRLIDYFYVHDSRLGTWQANSTRAMLSLKSEWGQYELKKTKPDASKYKISLYGVNIQQDNAAKSTLRHDSEYLLEGQNLKISEFRTAS